MPTTETPRIPRRRVRIARQRAWNAMRVLKSFTVQDIQVSAEINERNAYAYLNALHLAGYLRRERPKQNGSGTLWRLVQMTGPFAPTVRRAQGGIYDPNIDRFVPFSALEVAQAVAS